MYRLPARVRWAAALIGITLAVALFAATSLVGGRAAARPTPKIDRHQPLPPTSADVRKASAATTPTTAAAASTTTSLPVQPFRIIVDPAVRPYVARVDGFHDGDASRPVGRIAYDDGTTTDIVTDEVQLLAPDAATLASFVNRWGGTIIDVADAAPDGSRVALVRIDLARADTATVASDLVALEDGHTGDLRVSEDAVTRLLGVVARDALAHGTVVAPNALEQSDAIADGSTQEWDGQPPLPDGPKWKPDTFTWDLMRFGAPMSTGVTRAWQLLDATGKMANRVRIMIVDGGFTANPDFPQPPHLTLRQAKWGDKNRGDCGDHSCPWHGSDVVMAAMGLVDNATGGAGPAGPVADLIAVALYKDSYKTLRHTVDMVDEERPDIINMSFSSDTKSAKAATESLRDWYYEKMSRHGALLFASAGNKGWDVDDRNCPAHSCDENRLITPCESKYVVCVGGLRISDAKWDPDSSYGTSPGNKSVEIYGPFCTPGKYDHGAWIDQRMVTTCGTSFSSPFVAGVAALIKAANPALNATQILDLLLDSAHTNGPIADRTRAGSSRTVDAYEAVRRALGINVSAPHVVIEKPAAGAKLGMNQWVDLRATASDFLGRPLRVTFVDEAGKVLDEAPSGQTRSAPMSLGPHTVTASSTDMFGVNTSMKVTFELVNAPPSVTIVSPANGTERYTTEIVSLVAQTTDPDTYTSVANDQVQWTIRDAVGNTKWSGKGHDVDVGASKLGAGDFNVTVEAFDGTASASATSAITILQLAPNESIPVVWIDTPGDDIEIGAHNGTPQPVNLAGHAHDKNDGALAGTRFRWTATSHVGTVKLLCQGSAAGGNGNGGGIVLLKDCGTTAAMLGIEPGQPTTTWTILLEARNAQGKWGHADEVTVVVNYVTG